MCHTCMHTLSPEDMSHMKCCPAALMLALGETREEAKTHPFSELKRGVRSVSLRHSDYEAASPSGVMW